MRVFFVLATVLAAIPAALGGGPPVAPIFEGSEDVSSRSKIDELVFGQLKQLKIQPANLCSDAVFVRRAYLDVIGTLPTADEARAFLEDRSLNKRRALVDRLLEREEFADYGAMKWCDLLRVKAEFPINLWPNAVQLYHRWIRTSIKENLPYDQFARELLTASGSNFRVPQVNFYRAVQNKDPKSLAQAVALTFMGMRAEQWPEERLSGMAAFFSQLAYKETGEWKEEIVFFDSLRASQAAAAGTLSTAAFPHGKAVQLSADRDPRVVFADWLTAPGNPYFARNIVNRVWYWLVGRGIIHEPDDIRPDNPPSNAELLAWLEKDFVASRYDLKHLYREILNSRTYQLSSIPKSTDPKAQACFAYYPTRRLEAEVLIDALCQVTGTTEEYFSPIPEPFSFIPEGQRSIALADASVTSSFLEMFGRSPRDTGQISERNDRFTAAQRLHLLNSSHIRRKIEQGPWLSNLARYKRNPRETVTALYLTLLSRFPTDDELQAIRQYADAGEVENREIVIDLAWALINSTEFLYRH
jgi:hypothetical protein